MDILASNEGTEVYLVGSFFFNEAATNEIYTYGHTLSLHGALPISCRRSFRAGGLWPNATANASRPRRPWSPHLWSRTASAPTRSEEHTSELQSLMRISYAVFCLKKQNLTTTTHSHIDTPDLSYSLHHAQAPHNNTRRNPA